MTGINIGGRAYVPVDEDTRTIVWQIRRVFGGTDRTFAQGRGGFSPLAYYLSQPNVNVNQYVIDYPFLSPDREWIVYTRRDNSSPFNDAHDLMIVTATDDPSPVSIAISPATGTPSGSNRWLVPVGFSPDSSQVYYQCSDNPTDDDLELRRVDIDGSNDTLILAGSIPDFAAGVMARVSHDGTKIAYLIDFDGGGNRGIWVCDSDGSNNTKIYSGTSFSSPLDFYGWSRDDEWLLFWDQSGSPVTRTTSMIHPDGTGLTHLFQDTVAGGDLQSMVPTYSQHSLFTPDGTAVVVGRVNFDGSPVSMPGLLLTDGSETFTALPLVDVLAQGPILDYDGVRAYWGEGASSGDVDRIVSSLLDGSDYRIEDDMTDSSTTPQHDDYVFNGFFKRDA